MDLEEKRLKFINDYTKDIIGSLKFEEYVIGFGKENKSFCYRLETELRKLGSINGSTAAKFGVWYGKYGNNKIKERRYNPKFGSNVNDAFITTKNEIITLINAGKRDDYNTILNSKFGPVLRGKILSTYYPEKFIPIFSEEYLSYFIKQLDINSSAKNHIEMQCELLRYKKSNNNTKNMTNLEFSDYLYKFYDPKKIMDVDSYDEEATNQVLLESIDNGVIDDFIDEPTEKIKALKRYGKIYYPRDPENSKKALVKANFCCEFDHSHESFVRKTNNKRYTEAHHLIPMSAQGNRAVKSGLDVPANIISLCSECHNKLHYGKDFIPMLEKLFNDRIERLKQCNLDIDFDKLLEFYGVKNK